LFSSFWCSRRCSSQWTVRVVEGSVWSKKRSLWKVERREPWKSSTNHVSSTLKTVKNNDEHLKNSGEKSTSCVVYVLISLSLSGFVSYACYWFISFLQHTHTHIHIHIHLLSFFQISG
jgi:hypothetical protein